MAKKLKVLIVMSEMLGNQYFLGRNYSAAQAEFENCLAKQRADKFIKRKLIICYAKTGNLEKALELFNELINLDIKFIIDADPIKDDCPCAELLKNMDTSNYNLYESKLIYGILWLFCDPSISLEYFNEAFKIKPNHKFISQIINVINNYLNHYPIKMEKQK